MTIFKSKFQGVRRFAASQNRFQKFTHTPKHPRNTPFKPFMAIHITVVILVLDRDVFNSTLATLCTLDNSSMQHSGKSDAVSTFGGQVKNCKNEFLGCIRDT